MTAYEQLKRRLETKEALVGIIGLGYVGLPLAHALHQGGLRILGFDIDPAKIDALKKGVNYLKHLGESLTRDLSGSKRFEATADMGRLGECDAIIVCVPTPLGKHQEPDIAYIVSTAHAIGKTLRPGQLIALESTTYPGTTRQDMIPAMLAAASGPAKSYKSGEDFFVVFSPEREDPGRKSHNTRSTPKLLGGCDPRATELGAMLYRYGVETVVPVSSAEVAESAKLLENIFRAVNIALVNELKVVLTAMGIDVWEVIRAASTKPFGFMPFYPGPGLGGHCIPIDPFYLTWKAKEVGKFTRFIELAGQVNTHMPHYVVERTMLALNDHGKAIKGSRILVLGLAYKPDIDDTRESPSFELIMLLEDLGAEVDYSDPLVPKTPRVRRHDLQMASVDITPANLARYDAVVISTNHSAFDYRTIAEHARLVVDTRDALRQFESLAAGRLVRA